ncbi:MAG TPA: pyruvate kinase [Candidatus Scatomorpha intestinavium]|uniref:Pyruvate kinase n=1 Tax=Candidatus Scatomorpha intestinavium TaxID=2840922 RepID=A0A9D0ZGS4_9FIRM|nr:pyruvate kinase [Candidatus Scatomorpha intestinavium]
MGPAVDDEEKLRELMLNGMDAARFNFSHGTHESHLATLNKVKRVRDELGIAVATILDTKGPEIRIKTFENGPVTLAEGDKFTLTTRDVPGDASIVSVTYADLHKELQSGCRVLIDDGLIELNVDSISGQDIACTVRSGGPLSNNKSINIPDVSIHLPSLTEKDREDIRFAVEQDFDFIAASFVRKASDVEDIRACLKENGGEHIRIISKIENREGVENLEEIIAASDGLMVARGDLGVEIPAYEVPILQKRMIKETSMAGKPVITATQMLDSMIRNPRPTRAEVSDVANAVFDGTSCVMLSGETASGKHPIEAVQTMVNTIRAAEQATDYWGRFRRFEFKPGRSINDAVTHTCCQTAMDLEADAILTPTQTGHTARMISRFRPACQIVALTTTERARRQLAISWGVKPLLAGYVDSTDRLFSMCVQSALKEGAVESGQMVVITAGVPIGRAGSTNLIKAQVV